MERSDAVADAAMGIRLCQAGVMSRETGRARRNRARPEAGGRRLEEAINERSAVRRIFDRPPHDGDMMMEWPQMNADGHRCGGRGAGCEGPSGGGVTKAPKTRRHKGASRGGNEGWGASGAAGRCEVARGEESREGPKDEWRARGRGSAWRRSQEDEVRVRRSGRDSAGMTGGVVRCQTRWGGHLGVITALTTVGYFNPICHQVTITAPICHQVTITAR